MHAATYISAERYDLMKDSHPLPDETAQQHALFRNAFNAMVLDSLYGFPLWEKEVHDLLHASFRELGAIFRGYCTSLGEVNTAAASTMSLEEFEDFAVDVGLATTLRTNKAAAPALYTFPMMAKEFVKANQSGKGLAGPKADSELVLHEFLTLLTRISFNRLNPEFGELTMEHQESILPVPQCLERTLREAVLPMARRDDDGEFRRVTMQDKSVIAALEKGRPRLSAWLTTTLGAGGSKRGEVSIALSQWVSMLKRFDVLGTKVITQGSDIVGDDRVGTEFKCRLSVPQAKAAFVNAQQVSTESYNDSGAVVMTITGSADEDTT